MKGSPEHLDSPSGTASSRTPRASWARLVLVLAGGCFTLALILAVTTDQRRKQTALSAARRAILDLDDFGDPSRDRAGDPAPDAMRGHRLTYAELPRPLPASWEGRALIRAFTDDIPGVLRGAGRAVVFMESRRMRAEWMSADEFRETWDRQERDRLGLTGGAQR